MSCKTLAGRVKLWHAEGRAIMEQIISFFYTVGIIVLVILFFNLMIFVHELGHFLAGKWRGAYIDRFQIWFGKPIWQKEIGGVKWGLGWIPAGGFVSLPQMDDTEEMQDELPPQEDAKRTRTLMEGIEGKADRPDGKLEPLKPLDKVIIAAAGPFFSLLLAYVFAVIVWCVGKPSTAHIDTTIGYLLPNAPAAQAGLLPGDKILAIDGQKVTKWVGNMEGVTELVAMSEHEKITFDVLRTTADGKQEKLSIQSGFEVPETSLWQRSALRKVGILPAVPAIIGKIIEGSPAAKSGLQPGQRVVALNGAPIYAPYAILAASEEAKEMTLTVESADGSRSDVTICPALPTNWQGKEGATPILGLTWANTMGDIELEHPSPQAQVNQSLKWMGDTLEKVCAPGSNIGVQHLSGPVGIGSYIYKMLDTENGVGWRLVLWFAVVLNVNLAVLNMLPLPVVDGGHVVLGFIEMIRRKPINSRILNSIFMGFIMLLFGFFIFVTLMDIGDLLGGEKEPEELPVPVFSNAEN